MNSEHEMELRKHIALLERSLKGALDQISALKSELVELQARVRAEALEGNRTAKGKIRSKAMSRAWLTILGHMAEKGTEGMSVDAIEEQVKLRGLGIQRRAIRAQLSNYKRRKLIEQFGEAQYRLTGFGRMTLSHERHRAESTTARKY
ncbi:MAG TPA: winged-helix domain-containing protein [Hyphomicrobium sp.]|nr:winged-helix domain-containing protein [Hyphomicrobium sp.]